MVCSYVYRVQQFERKEWKTKVETTDIDFAFEQARLRHYETKERVRVIRVDTCELLRFMDF